MTVSVVTILAEAQWWSKTISYEIVRGNIIWRFLLVLLVVVTAMVAGRIVQFAIGSYAERLARKKGESPVTLLLKAIVNRQ